MLFVLAVIGLVTIAIVATILTEVEKFGWATLVLIASVVAAQWLHLIDMWDFVTAHATLTLLYVLGYVGTGIVWSFLKWFSFLMTTRDKYRQQKIEFLNKLGLDPNSPIPTDKLDKFQSSLVNLYHYDGNMNDLINGKRPRASKNKARIISWMSLWPCSVIGTVLNDPVRRIFNLLFAWFKALYQKMADRVFANDVELK